MRRLTFLLVALLLAPSALAEGVAAGDGSLVVTSANARIIYVTGSGLIWGHIDLGTLTILDYKPASGSSFQVTGLAMIKLPGSSTAYSGSDMRFLLPSGRYALRVDGVGIDISAVGKGTVSAIGMSTVLNGTLATNGGKALPLGSGPTTLVFAAGKAPNAVPQPKATDLASTAAAKSSH
jgi:hypothetical protein